MANIDPEAPRDYAGNVLRPLRGEARQRNRIYWDIRVLWAKQDQQFAELEEIRKRIKQLSDELEQEERDDRQVS